MEKTTIRSNMMKDRNYTPYCGEGGKCPGHWPRMKQLSNYQFKCQSCGFTTQIDQEFIDRYIAKHSLPSMAKSQN